MKSLYGENNSITLGLNEINDLNKQTKKVAVPIAVQKTCQIISESKTSHSVADADVYAEQCSL